VTCKLPSPINYSFSHEDGDNPVTCRVGKAGLEPMNGQKEGKYFWQKQIGTAT